MRTAGAATQTSLSSTRFPQRARRPARTTGLRRLRRRRSAGGCPAAATRLGPSMASCAAGCPWPQAAGPPGLYTGKPARARPRLLRACSEARGFRARAGRHQGPEPRLHPFRLVRINGNHLLGNSSVSVFSEIARQTGAGGADIDGIEDARAAALRPGAALPSPTWRKCSCPSESRRAGLK